MSHRNGNSVRRAASAAVGACCAGLLAAAVLATTPCRAASIPAWLDDSVSNWNAKNPAAQIEFINIKDSFVWYQMPKTPELGHQQIRERVTKIVLANGYQPMDEEELVTTGRPPVPNGPSTSKKCWSRSYVLNIQSQNNTKAIGEESPGQRQRMLTTLVCDDADSWWAAFRIAQ